jgi:signal transduction histidine kinase
MIAGKAIHPRTAPAAQRLAALGEMTSGIAHDFRNILTVIGSAIKMAELSSSRPERARACLAGAQEGIERGLKLTSELLMFAARGELSEAGEELSEAEEAGAGLHDVNVVLRKLERLLKLAAGPGVRVVLELAPDIPDCVIDPSRFDSAILNLVANARDAMAGAGEIQISTQLCSEPITAGPRDPRTFVRVRVKDSGEGMTSEVVQKIFDPFFTTKGAKGTGLGLPQVHDFVRQMHGHMDVVTERGIGTVIDLFFTPSGCGESSSLARREAEPRPVDGGEYLKGPPGGWPNQL